MSKNIVFTLALALLLISTSAKAQLVIVSPAGGENIAAGANFPILWNPHRVTGTISLSLLDSEHGTSTSICSNVPASQAKYVWHVPSNLAGTKFRVKISTTGGTLKGSAQNQAFFTVGRLQKGANTVAKPMAGVVRPFAVPVQKVSSGHPVPNDGTGAH
jgi:hypothetical protein